MKYRAANPVLSIIISILYLLSTHLFAEDATNKAGRIFTNAVPEITEVDKMSGIALEKLVADLMRTQGYEVGNLRASNDYGVDVIANNPSADGRRIAVQVKRSKNKITRKAISDAVAGMKYYNCNKAMVVTNNEFTEDAREFARGTDCILVDRTILMSWLDTAKSSRKDQSGKT